MIAPLEAKNKSQGGACHGQALRSALKTTRELWRKKPQLAMSAADEKLARAQLTRAAKLNVEEAERHLIAMTQMVERRKVRTCLVCGEKFDSAGPENRRCIRCVRHVAYQHGSRKMENVLSITSAFCSHKEDL